MLRPLTILLPLLGLVGCAPPPTVTNGTFTGSHTLTMQRGSADVVVKSTGTGTYAVTHYSMNHPMGSRPDTEATFTTSAGTFKITDKDVKDGMLINGKSYPNRGAGTGSGRVTVTIDENGAVTVDDPTTAEPKPKGDGK